MYTNEQPAFRETFYRVWEKIRKNEIIAEETENRIAMVIHQHPHYHSILQNPDRYLNARFEPAQDNPFLHMAAHIAISEQYQMDFPPGIRLRYQQLSSTLKDSHKVEHLMMQCLGQLFKPHGVLPDTQPDFDAYLSCIRNLTGNKKTI